MFEDITNDAFVYSNELISLGEEAHDLIYVRGSGTYQITVSAVATAKSFKNGVVGFQLVKDGNLIGIPTVEGSSDSVSPHSLSTSHLIKVDGECYIGIKNIGDDAIFDVDVIILREPTRAKIKSQGYSFDKVS